LRGKMPQKKSMTKLEKLRRFYNRYERYLIPGALVFGFITDVLTFDFLDFNLAMLLLLGQLLLVGANISVINLYEEKVVSGKIFSYWRVLAPVLLQYSFGNLFSAFLIFYSHSGSLFASWPFIVIVVFLMIGNEVFRKYNVRPTIQIGVYFFAIFSYLNILLPHLLKDLGAGIFIASGLIALFLVTLFIHILSIYTFRVDDKKRALSFCIGGIFCLMNFLYFFNFIPPIPLSMREIGVYHDIERVDSGYRVVTEKDDPLWRSLLFYERRHIPSETQIIYVFSAVYAPEEMELEVAHEWQRFNEQKRKFETIAEIPFTVRGGNDEGYNWFTYYNAYPGRWRVNVRTREGHIIERRDFYVIREQEVPRIIKEI